MEICELFFEVVAPHGKRTIVATMGQGHVLRTLKATLYLFTSGRVSVNGL